MRRFLTEDGRLFCESVDLSELADKTLTPFFVYSAAILRENFLAYKNAFASADTTVCFSVKSLSTLAILRLLADLGSGFDIVSLGELHRVRKAGGRMDRTVFAGVGKTTPELEAGLSAGLRMFNCESLEEVGRLQTVARRLRRKAPVALRLNPDVEPDTHHHITTGKKGKKFGLLAEEILAAAKSLRRLDAIDWKGLHIHIGSQILSVKPFVDAVRNALRLVDLLGHKGVTVTTLNIGGGLGIPYKPGTQAPSPQDLAEAVLPLIRPRGLELILEPGRSIAGPAGALIVRVEYVKRSGGKTFVITDGGMNDLIRPSLYDAYHEIIPLRRREGTFVADIVGPVCESGDFFAKDRRIPKVKEGDYLAVMDVGAYGSVMSSRYNSRPFAAELLVDGSKVRTIRRAETLDDMLRLEVLR